MPLLFRRCRHAGLALLLSFAAVGSSTAADVDNETPDQTLARMLDSNRSNLQVDEKGLGGPGAAALLQRARKAQFVLIGEDHGFANVPQFVLALKQSLGKDAPENLVLEIGPHAATRLAEAARKDELRRLALDYPGAMPFFDWQEDGQLARAWQFGQRRTTLWGIDQEFLFGLRMNLERLRELTRSDSGRAAIDALLVRDDAAAKAIVQKHDAGEALLLNLPESDIQALRAAVAPKAGSEAAQLIDGLQQTVQIYRGQNTDPYMSNNQRAQLMKAQFMRHYREAQRSGSKTPRALFRFGGYHMTRGLTPTGLFDIGNFAAELAVANDSESVHVLVITTGGTVNKWMPFVEDPAQKQATYYAREELESLGGQPFLDHAFVQGWTVFDVAPLRKVRKARLSGGTAFERTVFGYDYVVVIARASAATNYE